MSDDSYAGEAFSFVPPQYPESVVTGSTTTTSTHLVVSWQHRVAGGLVDGQNTHRLRAYYSDGTVTSYGYVTGASGEHNIPLQITVDGSVHNLLYAAFGYYFLGPQTAGWTKGPSDSGMTLSVTGADDGLMPWRNVGSIQVGWAGKFSGVNNVLHVQARSNGPVLGTVVLSPTVASAMLSWDFATNGASREHGLFSVRFYNPFSSYVYAHYWVPGIQSEPFIRVHPGLRPPPEPTYTMDLGVALDSGGPFGSKVEGLAPLTASFQTLFGEEASDA